MVVAWHEMKYCPRCAHALEERWVFGRTRRVCPACNFVFFREHKVATAAVVTRDNELLLVRRNMMPERGKWSIPGGFVDFDESPRQAAVREVLEETGYHVELLELLDVIFGQEHERGATLLIAYRARLLNGAPVEEIDEKEVMSVGFFPLSALPPIAFEATRRAIAKVRGWELGNWVLIS